MKDKFKHFISWHLPTIIGVPILMIGLYGYDQGDKRWIGSVVLGMYIWSRQPSREILCRKIVLSDTSGNVGIELYAQGFQNRLRIYQPPDPGAKWHPRGIELIADEKGNRLLVCKCFADGMCGDTDDEGGLAVIELESTKEGEHNLYVADN